MVNIVFGVGTRAGEAIVKHPDVPIISFTGSTAIGKRIQEVSAPFVKKLSLEVNLPVDSTIIINDLIECGSISLLNL